MGVSFFFSGWIMVSIFFVLPNRYLFGDGKAILW